MMFIGGYVVLGGLGVAGGVFGIDTTTTFLGIALGVVITLYGLFSDEVQEDRRYTAPSC